jgi:methylated-DNA-[protein]-cysteine S-methyltransferase
MSATMQQFVRGKLHFNADAEQTTCAVEVFSTALGWLALAQHGETLQGLTFGHTSAGRAETALRRLLGRDHALERVPCESELADRLRRFAAGEPVDFRHVAVDDRHLAPFARRVVAACRRIPWGQSRTYGQLAAACGSPGAARAVGQVMARNRFPLVVPCHRVLAAGGGLGGFSAPQGLQMKRRLLALEGATSSAELITEPAIP